MDKGFQWALQEFARKKFGKDITLGAPSWTRNDEVRIDAMLYLTHEEVKEIEQELEKTRRVPQKGV